MARYTHVVFDIDGTLVDTQFTVLSALRDTMKALAGKDMEMEELIFSFGIPGEETLRILGIEDTRAGILEWNRHILKYQSRSVLFEGIADVFSALKDVHIGIVTSKAVFEYEIEPALQPIKGMVGTAVCADHTEKHKPEPDPILKYMELTGAKREEDMYIGDSVYDQRCADAAGVDFALAMWGATNKELPARWKPERPVDLAEIVLG